MADLKAQVSVHSSVDSYPGCLVRATPLTVLYQSFWNFAVVFFMVWGCAYGLDIIAILFLVTFSTLWTFRHFSTSIYRQWIPCERTPHTILYQSFWNFAQVFAMVLRCACGLDIIYFCHFFHFVNSFSDLRFYEKCIDSGYIYQSCDLGHAMGWRNINVSQ